MKEEVLESIGFSKNEAKIYLALLELGSATGGEVSKISKVHRTNVYDALAGLVKKGVVAHVIKDGTTYYEPADPQNLMNVLKEKEDTLQKIIPELKLSKKMAPKKSDVHIFEGLRAIKDILNSFLEIKEERLVYGAPKVASKRLGPFLEMYHTERVKKKQRMLHIYNEDAIERIKYLNTIPFTEARYLPKEYDSPVATTICGNQVVLMLWPETQEEEPIAIQIINDKIAQAYKRYFYLMWKIAKKP